MSNKSEVCCERATVTNVESVLSIDARGQMVLPKDLRRRAGIAPGDKFAVVSHEQDGEVCCITLIKISSLNDVVKNVLAPVMKDVVS
jgi:antitoxin PrlF